MAPGPSRLPGEGSGKRGNALEGALQAYIQLLQTRPVYAKACTSAVIGSLGNLISQLITKDKNVPINWRNVMSFAFVGFFYIGPIMHHFYAYLDRFVPRNAKYAQIKRLILDRFVFAPPFLAVLYYLLAIVQGSSSDAAIEKIKATFWPVLLMNWRVWTIFQYINLNYVPQVYRVPASSVMALLWNIYYSYKTR